MAKPYSIQLGPSNILWENIGINYWSILLWLNMNNELDISIKLNCKHEDLKYMNQKFNIYLLQK